MIGIGNIVAVSTTITIGGPGGIVWLWIAALLGMIIKYSEVYLGIKYRIKNQQGSYDGGPMLYLQQAFHNKYIPLLVCIILCFYSVEIYQFSVINSSISRILNINKIIVTMLMLIVIVISSLKGVKRLANICTILMPPFILTYIIIGIYIILYNYQLLPDLFKEIFVSCFKFKCQTTGIIGGGLLTSIHYGFSNAVYSGDIGIGYDSIIQSESKNYFPEKQGKVAIYSLLTDTIICTITIFILLVTNIWTKNLPESQYIILGLEPYITHIKYFITTLLCIAGFTTITGYMIVGQKCARFINKKYGKYIYTYYAVFAFTAFTFLDQSYVKIIMMITSGFLVLINISGILILKKEIKFN